MEIVFDFDGTIADTFDLTVFVFNELKDELGYQEITEKEIDVLRDKGFREILKDIKISLVRLPLIIKRHQDEEYKYINEIKIFAGMKSLLKDLKSNGFVLGLVSSNSLKNVKKCLELNEIDIFDYIDCGSALFGKDKIIKRILKKRGLKKEEIIYMGDEIRDVEACKKVGVKVVAVTWGYNSKAGLSKSEPDYLVDEVRDLKKLLTLVKS